MKKTAVEFLKANGFYLSFGVGVVALVAALAIYNVNVNKKQQENQEINLNEPMEQEMAEATELEFTEEIQETILDGDMDVPMDMWQTGEVAEGMITEAQMAEDEHVSNEVETDAVAQESSMSDEVGQVESVMSNETLAYEPLEGLTFNGMEEVVMPVLGNTILPYSMDTTVYFETLETYRCNPGMLLQAPIGTDVVSIWHGQVVEVEETKEYGTTVTVDLGSGYRVTYGQLQDVRVEVGDEVWDETILGTVSAPTPYYEKEGEHLYLAMTKDGEPMNPMEVLQVE